jgi:two-component system response regulator AtoC
MQQLSAYSWPGNIRELRNVIERIVLMSTGTAPVSREEVIQVLPRGQGSLQTGDVTQLSLEEIERIHIMRVLDASERNKTQAAKTLAIDYKTLLSKLKKYGLGA